ncbi:MAG: CBS domain-containing protein, partial [Armatimonadetes bacterium]|nr:CBS domain-containing protein [Armatimonadota bacterium]
MDVIISHGNPDFDSLASMVAAVRLYPEAMIVLSGSPDQNVRDFLALHGQRFPIVPQKEIPKEQVARLIVVDTRQGERLAGFRDLLNDPRVEIHVYDHHPVLYNDLTGDYSVSERVGACTTMMVRLLREKDLPITPIEATLYMLGIYGDTGSLTFVSTTAEDVDAVAWLLRHGASLEMMAAFVSHSLSEPQRSLLKSLLENSSHYAVQGADVVIARAETGHYVEELAFLAQKFMDLERPDTVFVLVKMRDRLCIVGRSRVPAVDVGMILAPLGGGGHSTAASCVLKGRTLVDMERILLDNLKKKIRSPVLAADIMSHPVRTVSSAATVTDAAKEMARYGHNALVVCDEDRVVGIVSRRDVDKAVRHGYSSAPVHTCMSTNLVTASPDTPVSEIQHMMLTRGIGRVPVLRNDSLVGIITRTDLLQALRRQAFPPPQVSPSPRIEDLSRLPTPVQALLRRIGDLADQLEIPVFAVGGFVRDLLLGVENLGLDVVVEGDGIFFCRE